MKDAAHESLMTFLDIAMKQPMPVFEFLWQMKPMPSTPPDGPNPFFEAFQPDEDFYPTVITPTDH